MGMRTKQASGIFRPMNRALRAGGMGLLLLLAALHPATARAEDPTSPAAAPTSVPAAALPDSDAPALEQPRLPLFHGDRYRYPNLWLIPRALSSVVAIPAGIPTWTAGDWGALSATALVVGGLMLPLDPSPDVRLQRWLAESLPGRCFVFCSQLRDAAVWGTLGLVGAGFFLYGWLGKVDPFVEMISLVVEAFAVTEVYHVTLKLLLGREGPKQGDGLGIIYGPARAFSLFPDGTPSGHTASLYSIIGVLTTYWANPFVTVGMHALGLVLASALVVDRYHFISDVIYGGALGYSIGRWVVRHRSSRYHDGDEGLERITVIPSLDLRNGGAGVGLAIAF